MTTEGWAPCNQHAHNAFDTNEKSQMRPASQLHAGIDIMRPMAIHSLEGIELPALWSRSRNMD